MKKFLLALLLAVLVPMVAPAVPPANSDGAELSAEDLDRRRKALSDLLEEQWQYTLRTSPELASILGDRRYNDQLSDLSERAVQKDLVATRAFLRRFSAISTVAFSEQEKLNRDLMVAGLRESIDAARFRGWQMPVNQQSGVHLLLPQLPSMLPFATVRDYEDYIVRLGRMPRQLDDTIANMRKGMTAGLMPPRYLLEQVAEQAAGIRNATLESSPFSVPLAKFPEELSAGERERLGRQVHEAIESSVVPAYSRFERFVRDVYAPRGRVEAGIWALPDGKARYEFQVRRQTTTSLSPQEIHETGLREVVRIETEMLEIARRLGFDDLPSFNRSLETNPAVRPSSGEEILELYRTYIDQMYERLPELFGRLPRAKLEVVATPAFREKNAAAADYNTGSPDGSRPGRVNVNTWEATSRKTLPIESTAYHEGVPGHHMQLSIQQELTTLPPFRQQGGYTAFIEGWALYSERLGKEVGFYQDAYSDYGRLNDEMLRAIRLVVDTGLHDRRWNREQVVQFFREHSAIDEVEIQSETDRYIVWPGQALAYKIGQLKILELRERAQEELGSKFDIRGFHDEVLGAGALPLQALEERMISWIEKQK